MEKKRNFILYGQLSSLGRFKGKKEEQWQVHFWSDFVVLNYFYSCLPTRYGLQNFPSSYLLHCLLPSISFPYHCDATWRCFPSFEAPQTEKWHAPPSDFYPADWLNEVRILRFITITKFSLKNNVISSSRFFLHLLKFNSNFYFLMLV